MTRSLRLWLVPSCLFVVLLAAQPRGWTEQQATPPPQRPPGRGGGTGGAPPPNFPQQQRPPGDPAVVARGKGLYESICAACHGIDLRGGQQGGPNLLRSQALLSDKQGELIVPIVQNGRPNPTMGAIPMPPLALPPDDIKAVAEYLHSVLAQAGAQGRPPEGELVTPEKVLVGNIAAGEAFFQAKCGACHSVTGDLRGIASRVPDPRELQNVWVSGGGGGGRGRGGRGRGGRGAAGDAGPVLVTVTPATGPSIPGRLVRIDDFIVSLVQDDGTRRTFVRNGADPRVELRDPSDAHRTLVPTLSDTDMHNVTAYLWTIKQ